MSPPSRRDLIPILVLLGLAALFFHKVLFGGEVAITDSYARYYPWRTTAPDSLIARPAWNADNIEAYFPRRAVATDRVRRRDLPLWEPWTAGGTPFFADPQVALFYPLNWPLFAVDPADGMGLFLLAHFAWAGIGMYLFLKRIGIPRAAALVGAVVFMWNGFFVTRTGHPTVVASSSWLPWSLLAFERFWDRPTARRAALLALPIALSLLAGFPQAFLFIAYAVAALALARGARALRVGAPRPPARRLLLVPLLAVGLAAVQLLPTAELLRHSSRERWDYATLLSSAQHPAMLVRAVRPEAFGSPIDGSLDMGRFSRGNGYFVQSYVSTANYAGIVALLLAAAGALLWRGRWRATLVAIAAVALLLSFGTPLLRVYRLLPGLGVSRVDRVILLYHFALAALAAAGLASIAERARRAAASAHAAAGPRAAPARAAARALALLAAPAALALVVLELYPYGMRYNVSQPRGALPRSYWEIHYFDHDLYRSARVGEPARAILPGNVTASLEIPELQGMSDLPLRRWQELLEVIEPGIYSRRRLGPIRSEASLVSPLLDLLGVKRLLLLVPRDEGAAMKIVERPTALPRAFVVPRHEVVADRAARLARLAPPGFDPRAVVLLEEAPRAWVEGEGTAEIAAYDPERIVVRVDGSGGGLLVADNWYPGWSAWIDGRPTPILVGDHALRVVALPPGHHEVEMRFHPASLSIGAAVSVGSLALLLALSSRANGARGGGERSAAAAAEEESRAGA